MTTIVTRAGKGAPLTHTEMDTNFTNLQTSVDTPLDGVVAGTVTASKALIVDASKDLATINDLTVGTLNGASVLGDGVTATTQSAGDDSTKVATTAYADTAGTRQNLYIEDQKIAGTNGGTFTAGAWQTRDLNTVVVNNISGASLSSNQITLPAGTYDVEASASAFRTVLHEARLYNTTDSAVLLSGTSERSGTSSDNTHKSFIRGRFTIAGTKVITLQHRCSVTRTTTGFGYGVGFAAHEVFSTIEIVKV